MIVTLADNINTSSTTAKKTSNVTVLKRRVIFLKSSFRKIKRRVFILQVGLASAANRTCNILTLRFKYVSFDCSVLKRDFTDFYSAKILAKFYSMVINCRKK